MLIRSTGSARSGRTGYPSGPRSSRSGRKPPYPWSSSIRPSRVSGSESTPRPAALAPGLAAQHAVPWSPRARSGRARAAPDCAAPAEAPEHGRRLVADDMAGHGFALCPGELDQFGSGVWPSGGRRWPQGSPDPRGHALVVGRSQLPRSEADGHCLRASEDAPCKGLGNLMTLRHAPRDYRNVDGVLRELSVWRPSRGAGVVPRCVESPCLPDGVCRTPICSAAVPRRRIARTGKRLSGHALILSRRAADLSPFMHRVARSSPFPGGTGDGTATRRERGPEAATRCAGRCRSGCRRRAERRASAATATSACEVRDVPGEGLDLRARLVGGLPRPLSRPPPATGRNRAPSWQKGREHAIV